MIQRDLTLAEDTGAAYHVAHISTAPSVELVRQAKARGVRVTTEVCPHHLLLTDQACDDYDTRFKMNPPLRSPADIEACIAGVADGTIDCLITDHAPHSAASKEHPFQDAPFGIVGIETAVPLFVKALVEPGHIDYPHLIRCLTTAPARILGLPKGTLREGADADVTLIDPDATWTIDADKFASRSRNTPFDSWQVQSKIAATIVAGEIKHTALNGRFQSA